MNTFVRPEGSIEDNSVGFNNQFFVAPLFLWIPSGLFCKGGFYSRVVGDQAWVARPTRWRLVWSGTPSPAPWSGSTPSTPSGCERDSWMDDNKMYLIKIREIMEYFLTCSCFQKGCNFIDSIIIIITIKGTVSCRLILTLCDVKTPQKHDEYGENCEKYNFQPHF